MKKRMYSEEEMELLKKCKFVLSIKYGTQIEYDPLFKIWCIMMKLDKPELTAREIFERGGMNIDILHKTLPRRRISEWMYNYGKFGIDYFLPKDEPYTITDEFKKQLYKILKDRFNEVL